MAVPKLWSMARVAAASPWSPRNPYRGAHQLVDGLCPFGDWPTLAGVLTSRPSKSGTHRREALLCARASFLTGVAIDG